MLHGVRARVILRRMFQSPEGHDRGALLTLLKGIEILEALSGAEPEGMTHARLAECLGYPRSTLYRYLGSLEKAGFVESMGETRYRLGDRATTLSSSAARGRAFRRLAQRSVVNVSTLVGEPVHATIFSAGQSVTVASAATSARMSELLGVGTRRPAHRSASGRLFLAFSPESIAAPYIRLAEGHTGTDGEGPPLAARLASIRRAALATDESEYAQGINCIAAPVFDYTDRIVGSLSLTMAAPGSLRSALRQHAAPLRQGSRALSALLGYVPH